MNAHNWSNSVSQYLIKRREQTKQAYQPASMDSFNLNPKQAADSISLLFQTHRNALFTSFFYILGNELAQGHTIISVQSDSNEAHNKTFETPTHVIFSWQSEILELLLVEWLEITDVQGFDILKNLSHCSQILDTKPHSEVSLNSHYRDNYYDTETTATLRLQQNPIFKQVIYNSNLNKSQQDYLVNQFKLATELYHFFSQFNTLSNNSNCLHTFYKNLSKLSFFVKANQVISHNQNNNQHAPIVINFTEKLHNDGCNQLTFWVHRSWQAEQSVLTNIERLNQAKPSALNLNNVNKKTLKPEQLSAINTANNSAFSIITGGPGTGKTYTVAQLVIAIHQANESANSINQRNPTDKKPPLSIVLAAPTGKAAQRMQESLSFALESAGVDMHLQEAKTIHRLLGIGASGIPRYNIDNPLSEDIIIVDEASMLGVELANYLLSAVKTGARLILLGDSHQLSAVDAGAVLFDLCEIDSLKFVHANLTQSTRFTADSAIGKLANLINNPLEVENNKLTQQMVELIAVHDDIVLYEIDTNNTDAKNTTHKNINTQTVNHPINKTKVYQQLSDDYQAYFEESRHFLQQKTIHNLPKLMAVFNEFRVLTAGHHGNYGDDNINQMMTEVHCQFLKIPTSNKALHSSQSSMTWYHGRPVMVQKNNYYLGLFNGDIGLCIDTADGLAVYFEGMDKPMSLDRLGNLEVKTAYAMTVHKSQGSEFKHVAVMLGSHINVNASPVNPKISQKNNQNLQANTLISKQNQHLINREMLYTAVTRAKQTVSLYTNLPTITLAIMNPTIRQTGLGIRY